MLVQVLNILERGIKYEFKKFNNKSNNTRGIAKLL